MRVLTGSPRVIRVAHTVPPVVDAAAVGVGACVTGACVTGALVSPGFDGFDVGVGARVVGTPVTIPIGTRGLLKAFARGTIRVF